MHQQGVCHSSNTMKKLCVAQVPIFNSLSDQEMKEVASMSSHKNYQKGEIIFHAGELSTNLFIVHRGRVKIYRLADSGKEQLIRILDPGDFFGELALFTGDSMTGYAEALEDTEICMINQDYIKQLLIKYPTISIKIIEEFSKRLNYTEKLVEQLNSKDVEKRIASYLCDLISEQTSIKSNQAKITLPMSKKDLASLIGTSQETLSRRLSNLQNNGWIEQTGQRNITVTDVKGLYSRMNL